MFVSYFPVNVMGLDELEPAVPLAESTAYVPTKTPEKSKKAKVNPTGKKKGKTANKAKDKKTKKKESKPDLFSELGLYTVDDLIGNESDVSDTEERMGTEPIETDYENNTARSGPPLRSILSPSPRPPGTPKSSRSRVRLSLGDLEEIRYDFDRKLDTIFWESWRIFNLLLSYRVSLFSYSRDVTLDEQNLAFTLMRMTSLCLHVTA